MIVYKTSMTGVYKSFNDVLNFFSVSKLYTIIQLFYKLNY